MLAALFLLVFGLVMLAVLGIVMHQSRRVRAENEAFDLEKKMLLEKLVTYKERIEALELRQSVIQKHASNFVNSLDAEVPHSLMRIAQVLSSQQRLIASVEKGILEGEREELSERKRMVECLGPVGSQEDASTQDLQDLSSVYGQFSISLNWEQELEELFQAVGHKVYTASLSLRSLGEPAIPKLRAIYNDLRQAGITGISDPTES